MLANVQLYIAAYFYDIPELKAMAAARFEECATVGALHSNQFPLAVEMIYTIPAPAGRTLRDIVIKVVTENSQTLLDPSLQDVVSPTFSDFMGDTTDLSKDFALALLPSSAK